MQAKIMRTDLEEIEKRHRINVALWAYAYEIMDDPLVADEVFDRICGAIVPEISTGNEQLDKFFRTEFSPSTGMWIYAHPAIDGIRRIYSNLTGRPARTIQRMPTERQCQRTSGKSPFDSHFLTMLYFAYLGFAIVPGYFNDVEYRTEGGNLYLRKNEEEKVILLSDLFN